MLPRMIRTQLLLLVAFIALPLIGIALLRRLVVTARTLAGGGSGLRASADGVREVRSLAVAANQLADAAIAVSAAREIDDAIQVVADRARAIIGAHHALVTVTAPAPDADGLEAVSVSSRYVEAPAVERQIERIDLDALTAHRDRPLRLTRDVLGSHPAWLDAGEGPPVNGLMAAPLAAPDGRRLGAIQIADKIEGDFADEDAAILVQLAQMATTAIETARLQRAAAVASAAVEADKLKGELLSTVSHELRTPLAAIKGFSTTMLMYYEKLPRDEQLSFLKEIDGAADRLIELVDNLLHLSRLESGALKMEMAPVAVSGVLQAVVEDARRRYPERVIELGAEPGLPLVSADARRMRQVAANLVDNAVKFSPDGGAITVHARRTTAGRLAFSVRDRGIGIPAEHVGRVFERFYRVLGGRAAEIGGTGLGLAICKRIVDEHGGIIAVESTEGQGATFTVTLPPLVEARPAEGHDPERDRIGRQAALSAAPPRSDGRECGSPAERRTRGRG